MQRNIIACRIDRSCLARDAESRERACARAAHFHLTRTNDRRFVAKFFADLFAFANPALAKSIPRRIFQFVRPYARACDLVRHRVDLGKLS